MISGGQLTSGLCAAVTGVGDKLRTAANVFDKIGDRFESVKSFTDTCSKYLNKGADTLTKFDKIRVEFFNGVDNIDLSTLGNKFTEYTRSAHYVENIATFEDFASTMTKAPSLVETASEGAMKATEAFRALLPTSAAAA